MGEHEVGRVISTIFRPITLADLHATHPRDQSQRDFIDAIHDSRRNAANLNLGTVAPCTSTQQPAAA